MLSSNLAVWYALVAFVSAGPTGLPGELVKRREHEPKRGHYHKDPKKGAVKPVVETPSMPGTGSGMSGSGLSTDSSSSTPVNSNPTGSSQPVQGSTCDQWGKFDAANNLTLYNNQWGQGSGNGSQCLNLHKVDPYLAWSTDWDWANNPDIVKSYPNAVWSAFTGKKLSETGSIDASWSYEYTGVNVDADVALDIFTSSSADANAPYNYEVMIWLGRFGNATPIGARISQSPIALGNNTYSLWQGQNKAMTVYTFVASDSQKLKNSFHGDLMWFMRYLMSKKYISGSQILRSIGAGTETFTGTQAKFAVDKYSIKER